MEFRQSLILSKYKIRDNKAIKNPSGRPAGGLVVGCKAGITEFITLVHWISLKFELNIDASKLLLVFPYISPDHLHC
jgi:hypothetical protein